MKKLNKEQLLTVCNRFSILLHAVACLLGYFVIEAISRHSFLEAWLFVEDRTKVFLYNAFLIFVTTLAVYFVRRRIFARILLTVFWLFLGVVNGVLLANRVTPFTGPDLTLLKEGLGIFNKYLSAEMAVLAILAMLLVIAGVVVVFFKAPKYQGKMLYRLYVPGVLAAVLAFAGVTRYAIDHRILSTYFGNIASAYEDYGYPYCLAVTIFDTGVDKPNGYSEELIDTISERSKSIKTTDTEDLPNIIVIQLESFFDPEMVRYLELSGDPIPYFRQLMEEYSSGFYTVPSVGAGTANTEFETLTGMSMRYFGAGEYPYKGVVKENTCESAANVLSQLGYMTHAIHNNEANFYSRRTVYANLGFDVFISEEYMDTQDDVNELGWMRDKHLIKYIEQCLDASEKQDFVFTVSVQGHGAYPEEPFRDDYEIQVSGAPTEASKHMWEYYVNEIHEMDQFIQQLTETLESRAEDTVLLLYGDHLPTMGLTEFDMRNYNLFTTPYVIWDNMGLPRKETNLKAYQAVAEVMDRVGIHDGTLFSFHQTNRQEPEYQLDLQTLQYDMLYGKQYVYGGTVPFEKTKMKLGELDVLLDNVRYADEQMYYVYGDNFTQSSRLEINRELVEDTIFIDKNTLLVKGVEIAMGDELDVAQQSNSSTAKVLSRSPSITYQVPGVIKIIENAVDTALELQNTSAELPDAEMVPDEETVPDAKMMPDAETVPDTETGSDTETVPETIE